MIIYARQAYTLRQSHLHTDAHTKADMHKRMKEYETPHFIGKGDL